MSCIKCARMLKYIGHMDGIKIIATNKKAYFDYFIDETYEAGVELLGSEVKSVRLGHVNLKDGYCVIKDGEIFMINVHISPYEKGSFFNADPRRMRKLLLRKTEINRLRGKVEQKGFTLVPTKIYFKRGLIKIEVGLARGKELHDKRKTIAERDSKRQIERTLKEYNSRR